MSENKTQAELVVDALDSLVIEGYEAIRNNIENYGVHLIQVSKLINQELEKCKGKSCHDEMEVNFNEISDTLKICLENMRNLVEYLDDEIG